ncbi:MAG: NAD-dependent epimerase/dehydratase family protein [Candidatus Thalassarchaeaceae archaeon]|jgi:nucleoside-diphosphate-sugar epimerase|nr:NAD-dependent epimerase/dehydratase family protein [Candidatus Thalassarchaeaceae archaeon]
MATRILVTGALGQIGTELVEALRDNYNPQSVIATDIRDVANHSILKSGPFFILDVLDGNALEKLVIEFQIDTIYHLAALLSATGEKNPELCERVNVGGTKVVFECAKKHGLRVYAPSSIAVFGPDCPDLAPQVTPLNPTTVYGKTKVNGEQLGLMYWKQFGVDIRGIRYPGLISYKAPAGGGTTDYAVEIFSAAIESGHYDCFVRGDTRLPMMYMEDAIRATLELMSTPSEQLGDSRAGYNIAGCSFTVDELVTSIRRHLPSFTCSFNPDIRQQYADSWPNEIEDKLARKEWLWIPEFDLDRMVDAMFVGLQN